ncbi:MAG: DUF2293 domain-containing protein [Myxococcales bacterium]|nr:DUF2293 domain-containing protein [Myxococcales bacterium]
MSAETQVVAPGPHPQIVILADGTPSKVPEGWAFLKSGDAALTRRVKAAGPHWVVQVTWKRRTISKGLWAPAEAIAKAERMVERQRADPGYQRKLAQGRARRDREQANYVDQFERAVHQFLAFHSAHAELADALAKAIAAHATPVGSGTVARTERIPVERRAEAAVIAWLRHQTTGYDDMRIERVKGARREVRRALAERSRRLLGLYRQGVAVPPEQCPLRKALDASAATPAP